MRCPCCDVDAQWRELHRHLADAHADLVRFDFRGDRSYYVVSCPVCAASHEQAIKPRLVDPEFMNEYREEIRLVALDMLLNHVVGEHYASPGDPSPAQPADGGVG